MTSTVAVVRCERYPDVGAAVPRLLELLGGLAAFIQPGQSVLVKPNLLSDHTPEEAVTTHPEVVRGVIRAVRAAGAKPWVADCPANVADLARVWRQTGIEALCRDEAVPLVNLEKAGSERVEQDGFVFTIARPVLEADAIISVPKLKTHVLTRFTGAVKNIYGTIPGYQKTSLHGVYPRPDVFGALLLAAYRKVKPVLAIADGVVGMDGNGPSGGRPVALGFLAASADSVALDAVVCRRFGIRPDTVPYLREAARLGVGETAWDRIRRLGDEDMLTAGPALRPPTHVPLQRVPDWLLALLKPVLRHRPAFGAACVACGRCAAACPAGALAARPSAPPVLDAVRCLACCCCQEVCPAHAIEMEPSALIRAVRALRRKRS